MASARTRAASRRTVPATGERATAGDRLALGHLGGHLGYFLRRLQLLVFKDFIETLRPMRVRPAQYSVLLLIEANPGRPQAAIGKALSIERARLARLLHELERRNWIARRRGDGRAHALWLTRAGERALARIKTLTARHERQVATLLGRKRRAQLMELLREFG